MNGNDIEFLLEYLDRINAEIQKVRRAVTSIQEGVPFTEAFDEELFMEGNKEAASARSEIVVMMHHLLKFRFSTVDRALHSWFTRSIALPRREIIKDIEWNGNKQSYDKTIVMKILNNYGDVYKDAVKAYEDDAKKYQDLKPGLKYIPAECPWTLWDLASTPFDELLDMIPPFDKADEIRLEKRKELIVDFGHEI